MKDHVPNHKQPPPGMRIVRDGFVREGDYFFIAKLGAWGPVPRIGWGEPVANSLIARGTLDWSRVGERWL